MFRMTGLPDQVNLARENVAFKVLVIFCFEIEWI